jgi:hypothetical protein
LKNNKEIMELYIPSEIEVKKCNPQNGRFLKGHEPWNKGKKAKDYMSAEAMERMLKGLEKGRVGNTIMCGWNKKPVVAIKEGKVVGFFESASKAGKELNIQDRNIRSVCDKRRKTAGGMQFFWAVNNEYLKYVKI